MLSAASMKILIVTFAIVQLIASVAVDALQTDYMAEHCGREIYMKTPALRLRFQRSSLHDELPAECTLRLKADPNYRINARVVKLSMREPMARQCATDRLDIFVDDIATSYPITPARGLCGTVVPQEYYHSTKNILWLKQLLSLGTLTPSPHLFEIIFTRYRTGTCYTDEFSCCDGNCISRVLHGDSTPNCPDASDESLEESCPSTGLGTTEIILIAAGSIILIVVVAVIILLWRKNVGCFKTRERRATCFGHTQPHCTKQYYQMQTSTVEEPTAPPVHEPPPEYTEFDEPHQVFIEQAPSSPPAPISRTPSAPTSPTPYLYPAAASPSVTIGPPSDPLPLHARDEFTFPYDLQFRHDVHGPEAEATRFIMEVDDAS